MSVPGTGMVLFVNRHQRILEGAVIEGQRALQERLAGEGDQAQRARGRGAAQNPGWPAWPAATGWAPHRVASMLREQSSTNTMSWPSK